MLETKKIWRGGGERDGNDRERKVIRGEERGWEVLACVNGWKHVIFF